MHSSAPTGGVGELPLPSSTILVCCQWRAHVQCAPRLTAACVMPVLAEGGEETKGHLDFEQDPSDRNGLVSDLFTYPVDDSAEANTAALGGPQGSGKKSVEGGNYIGKVQLKLLTSTSGVLLYTSEDEVCPS